VFDAIFRMVLDWIKNNQNDHCVGKDLKINMSYDLLKSDKKWSHGVSFAEQKGAKNMCENAQTYHILTDKPCSAPLKLNANFSKINIPFFQYIAYIAFHKHKILSLFLRVGTIPYEALCLMLCY
jgi:hypothetical protein